MNATGGLSTGLLLLLTQLPWCMVVLMLKEIFSSFKSFSGAQLIGCMFHFKQANRGRWLNLAFLKMK